MGKFFRANDELGDYLVKELDFTKHPRTDSAESGVEYYTEHSTGNQVKIDSIKKLVTLLDNEGYTVEESSSFTDNQIKSFLEE